MKKRIMKQMLSGVLSVVLCMAPVVSNACTSMVLAGADGGRVYGKALQYVPLLK